MGQTTSNISIYIPAAGETNYDASFANGMTNVDQHDHTGGPTKGVQISTTGLVDGSVTYPKLNANVVNTTTGLGTEAAPFENRITTTGLLKQLAQMTTQLDWVLITGNTGVPEVLPNSGTAGWVLTANAGAKPSWQFNSATPKVIRQVFTTPGANTYTPTVGMVYCDVEIVGGGGGGGGADVTGAGSVSGGSGGGSGEYAQDIFSAGTIGASQTITIGAAGSVTAGADGGDGGTTSLGALMTAFGGKKGLATTAGTTAYANGGLGGTGGAGGSVRTNGNPGGYTSSILSLPLVSGGFGGNSQFGAGGQQQVGGNGTGPAASGYGAGGGGATNGNVVSPAVAGGAGFAGLVIITEYCT